MIYGPRIKTQSKRWPQKSWDLKKKRIRKKWFINKQRETKQMFKINRRAWENFRLEAIENNVKFFF